MEYEGAEILLDIMIENSARILRAGFGVNHAESAFFAVIALLQADTGLKNHFLNRVESALNLRDPGCLDEGVPPQELIELVAHEMRWEELNIIAERRVRNMFDGDWSRAAGDISQHMIEAQNDNWPDREFYEHYSP